MNADPKQNKSDIKEQTVLLAVFDIMGFSNKVRSLSLQEVYYLYEELRERTVSRYELWSFDLLGMDDVHVPAILRLDVESHIFSDSVFAWVPLKRGFSSPFMKWCCDFVCEALSMDIPIRGAIAAGDAILDKATNTFMGKPIVEAHELEDAQDWIGIAFAHSAMWPPLVADMSPKLIIEYEVPLKKGVAEPIALDWPRFWREYYGGCASSKLETLRSSNPKEYSKYYTNAAEFARHSQKRSNWFNEPPQPADKLTMVNYNNIRKHFENENKKEIKP